MINTANSSSWQWEKNDQGSYLTCKLLEGWQHGFFSSHFQGKPPEILIKYLHPSALSYRLKQIHSDIIISTDMIDNHFSKNDNNQLMEGDGIITQKSLQSVWVASADCTPVLIADSKSGKVAAIHSGWRGTASEVVPKAIKILKSEGCQGENLLFALGPAISGKVYQVEEEVAVKVLKTIISNSHNLDNNEILTQGYLLPNQPILKDSTENKVRLNVTQIINSQIQQEGILPHQIAISPYCTYQTPEYFFSYRRSHEKNVQWSGIISV
ncbi:MAG: peptidoglycan editing factor PgeF [Cyanobacteria bacterium]|nr:peptidoglycan editing factor PgeF [Cyanobacteria bacterium CG_2015-16_32_12]NCO77117.1 peptidoglycan editing factor PgeF [Cyanobacteria bacterium CG_2015-22_32_23]NCQ03940.1 peptidoglycan editing factor PgeF [Cyanobacteria bacterium CG_2015-09_32_10]NCQ42452.1 peptidoglycan editing factor PgeF [Cyanobacteria bacterium CG_2015-04_32_10]NCS85970.1 peptidoglycan editing factor PgeF [Cyanobacteria bacterium CG_2015-02_32_10]